MSTLLPSSNWILLADTSDNEQIRDRLVSFWLSAPSDQLENPWNNTFGQITSSLVRDLNSEHNFSPYQIEIRDSIGSFFNQHGLSHPLSPQLMIANFLLSPPGLLRVNNCDQYFEPWLTEVYKQLYVSVDAVSEVDSPGKESTNPSVTSSTNQTPPAPDFGPFPSDLIQLQHNRIHLNRLLGLSNLYYIDPEDEEVKDELLQLRIDLARAIDATPESALEQLWTTDIGDRFWSLVRSGIQSVDLSPVDTDLKNKVISRLSPSNNGGFGSPNSTNAFLIAMMYFIPGSMVVDSAQEKIPAWLYPFYKEIFENNFSKN